MKKKNNRNLHSSDRSDLDETQKKILKTRWKYQNDPQESQRIHQ